MIDLQGIGRETKAAARKLALLNRREKDHALTCIAECVNQYRREILEKNKRDCDQAKKNGMKDSLWDRLYLNDSRLDAMIDDVLAIVPLEDPIGYEFESKVLANGLRLCKRSIPLGVLGAIYEARPNVTLDISALALKSGNGAILRGGSECLRTNLAIMEAIHDGLHHSRVAKEAISYIDDVSRDLIPKMVKLDAYIDVIIPRGGEALQRLCKDHATIPVITGGVGVCHIFVDKSADYDTALNIIENAKTQRPSVCNTVDTVLIHSDIKEDFLPLLARKLAQHHIEWRCCQKTFALMNTFSSEQKILLAQPKDFQTEWLGLTLGIKSVASVAEAIEHIYENGSEHSDAILTSDINNARLFIDSVQSSAVFVNASTRFNDGSQFGLGAEVAVSTQKLHARGPMGLKELTTYKWIVMGTGQIRS